MLFMLFMFFMFFMVQLPFPGSQFWGHSENEQIRVSLFESSCFSDWP